MLGAGLLQLEQGGEVVIVAVACFRRVREKGREVLALPDASPRAIPAVRSRGGADGLEGRPEKIPELVVVREAIPSCRHRLIMRMRRVVRALWWRRR